MFSILTSTGVFLLVLVTKCLAEQQIPLSHVSSEVNHLSDPTWAEKYGDQYDQPFSGPLSFSHLPYHKCLEDTATPDFDIAILGLPFDTGVSYRPGARFGPFAIRSGSRRQRGGRGYSLSWGLNPYLEGNIVDCGDVPVNPFDNRLAVDQIEVAYSTLLRRVSNPDLNGPMHTALLAKDGLEHPRIVSLGGDHTIVLPILRSLNKIYGPVAVIHFDAHLVSIYPFRHVYLFRHVCVDRKLTLNTRPGYMAGLPSQGFHRTISSDSWDFLLSRSRRGFDCEQQHPRWDSMQNSGNTSQPLAQQLYTNVLQITGSS
jgi:hypothetical protein